MPRIQHKRGTSANLASVNPTPLAGELVFDSTENAIKIGDGATAWSSLAYVTATPRTHTHSADAITTGTIDYARLPVGSTTSTVCAGDDARLTDARTPTAHKATHATGGSDALTPGDIGAAPAVNPAFTGAATFATTGNVVPLTVTNTGTGNSFVVNDAAGDTTPFVVDAAGNVLIGSGTAVGYADYSALTLRNVNGGVITLLNGSGTAYGEIAVTPTATSFKTATSHPIWFGTNNAERMRLTAAGDLGLGPSRTAPASRLDVNGVITVSATSGSAGSYLPSLTFSGDANTGFGQVSGQSDTASVFTAGHERVRVDASGRVGLGTTPSHALDVASTSAVSARIRRATAGGQANLRIEDGDGSYYDLATVGNVLAVISNTSERMRIDASGRLAIGTASASSLLTVNGVITVSATSGSAGSYAPSVTFSGDSNTGFGQVSGQSDTASVFTAGHERVRVDASGRVGIGTATLSPWNGVVNGEHLVVGSGSSGLATAVTLYTGTNGSGAIAFADGTTTTDQYRGLVSYSHSTDSLRLWTASVERLRIDSSGAVGIATTSPTAFLDINADTIRLRTAKTPASASDTGNAGDICWDASYLYICTATNTWRRIAHSTW